MDNLNTYAYKNSEVKEIAHIAVIMAESIPFEMLYEQCQKQGFGYIGATELIADWAIECYNKTHLISWDNEEHEGEWNGKRYVCWDDLLIDYANQKYKEFIK